MARITVEDCLKKVPSRFNLVLLAAQRTRELALGVPANVESNNDKNTVLALREIADGRVDLDALEEEMIYSLQKCKKVDKPEEENFDLGRIGESIEELLESAKLLL